MIFLILLIVFLLIIFFFVKMKKIKTPCITMITGDPKTGKSWLTTCLAIKQYKKNLLRYKIRKYIFRKKDEKPILYSNIKLANVEYTLLTEDIILRKKRMPYKSVVLINEASLVADCMNYKDTFTNDSLTLFFKLFGHETRGGMCFLDTQNLKDVHYSIKRCCSTHIHIHNTIKFPLLPFACMKVREMISDEDGNSINTVKGDFEENLLNLYILKKWWKYYDCYTYSILTDDLEVYCDNCFEKNSRNLKTDKILSLRPFKSIDNRFYTKNNINSEVKKNEIRT